MFPWVSGSHTVTDEWTSMGFGTCRMSDQTAVQYQLKSTVFGIRSHWTVCALYMDVDETSSVLPASS